MKGKKRERIIRVLLNQTDGSLTKYRISKLAGTSISWTIDYLRSLEKMSLISGTMVLDHIGLFNEWNAISTAPRRFDFFIADPKRFLKGIDLEYALSTYFAENYSTRILFPTRADIYIAKEDFEKWRDLLIVKGLMGKGNVRLLIDDEHVFFGKRTIDGLTIVSEPQLMLDLLREGGVCHQAFELMVKEHVR